VSRNINSRWWHLAVNVIGASHLLSRDQRHGLLTRCGIELGTSIVESGCWFWGNNVEFGEWCMINHGCQFDARDRITLGARVGLAPDVLIVTSTHEPGDSHNRRADYTSAPVVIGDGTWIGTRATVLPGVTIGHGCVIAAGAVVAKDCEPDGLYGGVPAKRLRDLEA